jgi:perosamine synthetase
MEKIVGKKRIEEYPVGSIFDEEEVEAVRRVLTSGETLTRGEDVELFEKEFAKYTGAKYAISMSSCGAALKIANQVTSLTSKDEVICQANAFWVTIVSLIERNVKFKVADIDPENLNIDPDSVKKLITPKTKAIYVMHHGGNPADLDPLREIAQENNLVIIEDAAHATGAEYKGKKIGSDSDIACFSFSTLKNMVTLGEGGILITNNEEYANMADKLRTNWPFGERVKNQKEKLGEYFKPKSVAFMHAGDAWDYDWKRLDEIGSTYRMSAAQAAVGRVQLKKLDKHNSMRERIAEVYNNGIEVVKGFSKTKVLPNCKNSWHLYSYFVNPESGINRDQFVKTLEEDHNIHIVTRFWPIHLGGIMRMRGHGPGEAPVCEKVWFKEQLALPISPQMPDEEINTIVNAVKETAEKIRK